MYIWSFYFSSFLLDFYFQTGMRVEKIMIMGWFEYGSFNRMLLFMSLFDIQNGFCSAMTWGLLLLRIKNNEFENDRIKIYLLSYLRKDRPFQVYKIDYRNFVFSTECLTIHFILVITYSTICNGEDPTLAKFYFNQYIKRLLFVALQLLIIYFRCVFCEQYSSPLPNFEKKNYRWMIGYRKQYKHYSTCYYKFE